jgi:putative flippase GtrA
MKNEKKIIKFIITGVCSAIINLSILYILVNKCGFDTKLQENIANLFSMEISIIVNFFFSRNWTWQDSEMKFGIGLIKQCLVFHLIVGGSIIIRTILFPLLQLANVNYIINAGLGIGIGAVFNYFLYDKFVFIKKEQK